MTARNPRSVAAISTQPPGSRIRTNHRSDAALSIVLLVAGLLLTLPFRSISLDDFDSYSFALALEDFNLPLQQPQPPGFPVYIALANIIYAMRRDPVFALTLLSAVSGAVSIWLVYRLGRVLDPAHPLAALGAALLFAVIPVSWLTSGKALSDMPGLACMLLSLWLLLRWRARKDQRPPYAAAAITGLSLGVRPQNALPVALLVSAYLYQDIARRRTMTTWLTAAGIGLLGILAWLIPVATLSGGLGTYLDLVRVHAGHVGRADALLGMNEPLKQALRTRLFAFGDTALISLTGAGLTSLQTRGGAESAQHVWRALAWGLFVVPGLLKAGWRRWQMQWLGVWWLAVALQILIFETLDRPRLLLPLVPPLALLIVAGWARIVQRRLQEALLVSAAFLAVALQTLPLVTHLSQIPAPPVQATHYIAAHYPADQTLVAAAGSFRAAQVELSAYPLAYLYTFDPDAVSAALRSGTTYVAILDRDQFTPEAIAVLSRDDALVTVEDRLFSRERSVHTQHDQVRLQILAPPDKVPTTALKLSAEGCIDLGAEGDARYLGQGWFRPEPVSGVTARWAGGMMTSTLRLVMPADAEPVLRVRSLAYPPAQSVTVALDGEVVATIELPQAWAVSEVTLREEHSDTEGITVLTLTHRYAQSPFDASGGTSSDRRMLTAAYDWLCLSDSSVPPGDD